MWMELDALRVLFDGILILLQGHCHTEEVRGPVLLCSGDSCPVELIPFTPEVVCSFLCGALRLCLLLCLCRLCCPLLCLRICLLRFWLLCCLSFGLLSFMLLAPNGVVALTLRRIL